jgi:HPt (histidine-containing phosphotransfer) domain-containing protein
MGLFEHRRPESALLIVAEDGFDELRDAFCDQLEEERWDLMALVAALDSAGDKPAHVLDALVLRAHRLKGRADIFELSSVARAAQELEQAAVRASMSREVPNDRAVRMAIAVLVRQMAALETTGTVRPRDPIHTSGGSVSVKTSAARCVEVFPTFIDSVPSYIGSRP